MDASDKDFQKVRLHVRPVPWRARGGWVRTQLELPPVGSKVLVLGPDCRKSPPEPRRLRDVGKVRLGRTWRHARADLNARILDRCSYRVDDEPLRILSRVALRDHPVDQVLHGVEVASLSSDKNCLCLRIRS